MMVAGTYVLTDTIEQSFDDIFTESNQGDRRGRHLEGGGRDRGRQPGAADRREPAREGARRRRGRGGGRAASPTPRWRSSTRTASASAGGGAPTFAVSTGPSRFDPLTYREGGPPQSRRRGRDRQGRGREGRLRGRRPGDPRRQGGGPRVYTLVGLATLGDVDSFGGASLALLTLPEAQRITGKQGQFDEIIVARRGRRRSRSQLATRTRADAAEAPSEVETGEENTQSQQEDIDEFIGILQTVLLVFAGVALFVASFLIFNTFSITVAQRTREFAMLRTLGANRRQIITSVVVEALRDRPGRLGARPARRDRLRARRSAPCSRALGIDLPKEGTVVATRTVIVSLALGTALTLPRPR